VASFQGQRRQVPRASGRERADQARQAASAGRLGVVVAAPVASVSEDALALVELEHGRCHFPVVAISPARQNLRSLLYGPEPQVENCRIFEATHKSACRILRKTCTGVARRCLQFSNRFWGCLATIGQPQPSQGCWLEKRPGEALAVGTMTHRSRLWLDICRASDRATMASAVDLLEKPHALRRAAVGTLHSPQLSHRTQVGA
jgi:hypothetical protein